VRVVCGSALLLLFILVAIKIHVFFFFTSCVSVATPYFLETCGVFIGLMHLFYALGEE
jgi:hypothetical protein